MNSKKESRITIHELAQLFYINPPGIEIYVTTLTGANLIIKSVELGMNNTFVLFFDFNNKSDLETTAYNVAEPVDYLSMDLCHYLSAESETSYVTIKQEEL